MAQNHTTFEQFLKHTNAEEIVVKKMKEAGPRIYKINYDRRFKHCKVLYKKFYDVKLRHTVLDYGLVLKPMPNSFKAKFMQFPQTNNNESEHSSSGVTEYKSQQEINTKSPPLENKYKDDLPSTSSAFVHKPRFPPSISKKKTPKKSKIKPESKPTRKSTITFKIPSKSCSKISKPVDKPTSAKNSPKITNYFTSNELNEKENEKSNPDQIQKLGKRLSESPNESNEIDPKIKRQKLASSKELDTKIERNIVTKCPMGSLNSKRNEKKTKNKNKSNKQDTNRKGIHINKSPRESEDFVSDDCDINTSAANVTIAESFEYVAQTCQDKRYNLNMFSPSKSILPKRNRTEDDGQTSTIVPKETCLENINRTDGSSQQEIERWLEDGRKALQKNEGNNNDSGEEVWSDKPMAIREEESVGIELQVIKAHPDKVKKFIKYWLKFEKQRRKGINSEPYVINETSRASISEAFRKMIYEDFKYLVNSQRHISHWTSSGKSIDGLEETFKNYYRAFVGKEKSWPGVHIELAKLQSFLYSKGIKGPIPLKNIPPRILSFDEVLEKSNLKEFISLNSKTPPESYKELLTLCKKHYEKCCCEGVWTKELKFIDKLEESGSSQEISIELFTEPTMSMSPLKVTVDPEDTQQNTVQEHLQAEQNLKTSSLTKEVLSNAENDLQDHSRNLTRVSIANKKKSRKCGPKSRHKHSLEIDEDLEVRLALVCGNNEQSSLNKIAESIPLIDTQELSHILERDTADRVSKNEQNFSNLKSSLVDIASSNISAMELSGKYIHENQIETTDKELLLKTHVTGITNNIMKSPNIFPFSNDINAHWPNDQMAVVSLKKNPSQLPEGNGFILNKHNEAPAERDNLIPTSPNLFQSSGESHSKCVNLNPIEVQIPESIYISCARSNDFHTEPNNFSMSISGASDSEDPFGEVTMNPEVTIVFTGNSEDRNEAFDIPLNESNNREESTSFTRHKDSSQVGKKIIQDSIASEEIILPIHVPSPLKDASESIQKNDTYFDFHASEELITASENIESCIIRDKFVNNTSDSEETIVLKKLLHSSESPSVECLAKKEHRKEMKNPCSSESGSKNSNKISNDIILLNDTSQAAASINSVEVNLPQENLDTIAHVVPPDVNDLTTNQIQKHSQENYQDSTYISESAGNKTHLSLSEKQTISPNSSKSLETNFNGLTSAENVRNVKEVVKQEIVFQSFSQSDDVEIIEVPPSEPIVIEDEETAPELLEALLCSSLHTKRAPMTIIHNSILPLTNSSSYLENFVQAQRLPSNFDLTQNQSSLNMSINLETNISCENILKGNPNPVKEIGKSSLDKNPDRKKQSDTKMSSSSLSSKHEMQLSNENSQMSFVSVVPQNIPSDIEFSQNCLNKSTNQMEKEKEKVSSSEENSVLKNKTNKNFISSTNNEHLNKTGSENQTRIGSIVVCVNESIDEININPVDIEQSECIKRSIKSEEKNLDLLLPKQSEDVDDYEPLKGVAVTGNYLSLIDILEATEELKQLFEELSDIDDRKVEIDNVEQENFFEKSSDVELLEEYSDDDIRVEATVEISTHNLVENQQLESWKDDENFSHPSGKIIQDNDDFTNEKNALDNLELIEVKDLKMTTKNSKVISYDSYEDFNMVEPHKRCYENDIVEDGNNSVEYVVSVNLSNEGDLVEHSRETDNNSVDYTACLSTIERINTETAKEPNSDKRYFKEAKEETIDATYHVLVCDTNTFEIYNVNETLPSFSNGSEDQEQSALNKEIDKPTKILRACEVRIHKENLEKNARKAISESKQASGLGKGLERILKKCIIKLNKQHEHSSSSKKSIVVKNCDIVESNEFLLSSEINRNEQMNESKNDEQDADKSREDFATETGVEELPKTNEPDIAKNIDESNLFAETLQGHDENCFHTSRVSQAANKLKNRSDYEKYSEKHTGQENAPRVSKNALQEDSYSKSFVSHKKLNAIAISSSTQIELPVSSQKAKELVGATSFNYSVVSRESSVCYISSDADNSYHINDCVNEEKHIGALEGTISNTDEIPSETQKGHAVPIQKKDNITGDTSFNCSVGSSQSSAYYISSDDDNSYRNNECANDDKLILSMNLKDVSDHSQTTKDRSNTKLLEIDSKKLIEIRSASEDLVSKLASKEIRGVTSKSLEASLNLNKSIDSAVKSNTAVTPLQKIDVNNPNVIELFDFRKDINLSKRFKTQESENITPSKKHLREDRSLFKDQYPRASATKKGNSNQALKQGTKANTNLKRGMRRRTLSEEKRPVFESGISFSYSQPCEAYGPNITRKVSQTYLHGKTEERNNSEYSTSRKLKNIVLQGYIPITALQNIQTSNEDFVEVPVIIEKSFLHSLPFEATVADLMQRNSIQKIFKTNVEIKLAEELPQSTLALLDKIQNPIIQSNDKAIKNLDDITVQENAAQVIPKKQLPNQFRHKLKSKIPQVSTSKKKTTPMKASKLPDFVQQKTHAFHSIPIKPAKQPPKRKPKTLSTVEDCDYVIEDASQPIATTTASQILGTDCTYFENSELLRNLDQICEPPQPETSNQQTKEVTPQISASAPAICKVMNLLPITLSEGVTARKVWQVNLQWKSKKAMSIEVRFSVNRRNMTVCDESAKLLFTFTVELWSDVHRVLKEIDHFEYKRRAMKNQLKATSLHKVLRKLFDSSPQVVNVKLINDSYNPYTICEKTVPVYRKPFQCLTNGIAPDILSKMRFLKQNLQNNNYEVK